MNDIVMEVNNPTEYLTALSLARNAFLENVSININNKEKTFSNHLNEDVQDGIDCVFSPKSGFFPAAQTRQYSSEIIYNPYGFGANVHLYAVYMCSEKERNDFTCIAAEISNLLNSKYRNITSEYEKIKVFADWVRRYFAYKNNDVYQDHSAVELLKNRTGVCQAISALACVVLPYMGIKTQYVVGEGKGISGWGSHAWNMVLLSDRWVHVDFTFAMNAIGIPMTDGIFNRKIFMNTHKWDEKAFSDVATMAKYNVNNVLFDAEIILYLNKEYIEINGVKIHSRVPVYYEKNNAKWIRYYDLIRYIGGGCELNYHKDELYICVASKRYSIRGAMKVIDMELCGVRKESLDALKIRNVEINGKLMFRFKGSY